eukprot:TRINITY_DN12867_c0_g1_i1.p1 TRINITY_DN12867_c0_g1~~TRINITY_DN12867_c0_g1_i1.p1  ORF type:complete len:891 (+),score=79.62 TRINITY_DN12867_c0_g1_i1:124-2673(+)
MEVSGIAATPPASAGTLPAASMTPPVSPRTGPARGTPQPPLGPVLSGVPGSPMNAARSVLSPPVAGPPPQTMWTGPTPPPTPPVPCRSPPAASAYSPAVCVGSPSGQPDGPKVPQLPLAQLQSPQTGPGASSPRVDASGGTTPVRPLVVGQAAQAAGRVGQALPGRGTPASGVSVDVSAAPTSAPPRASSAGAPRCSAFPGLVGMTSGCTTAHSSGSSIHLRHAPASRPRSAQSRIGAYAYVPHPAPGARMSTARGRASTVASSAPAYAPSLSPRPDGGAHRAGSLGTSSVRGASPRHGHEVALPGIWAEILEITGHASNGTTRPIPAKSDSAASGVVREASQEPLSPGQLRLRSTTSVGNAPGVTGGGATPSNSSDAGTASGVSPAGRSRDQPPPDPVRTRKLCQLLVTVVNRLPDDLLRRALMVLSEELFHGIFRDYSSVYDPRSDTSTGAGRSQPSRPPRLCEESLNNVMPYSAVVQSLRDTAKDAIMRRLELEAKCNCTSGSGVGLEASSRPLPARQSSTGDGNMSEAQSRISTSTDGLRAQEEVTLREELRSIRLLADTYKARMQELEQERSSWMEVRRARESEDTSRRPKAEEARLKIARNDLPESARSSRASYESDRLAIQAAEGGLGASLNSATAGSTSSRGSPKTAGTSVGRRPHGERRLSPSSTASQQEWAEPQLSPRESRRRRSLMTSKASSDAASLTAEDSTSRVSEDSQRTRPVAGARPRTALGSARDTPTARSLRTPRGSGGLHTSSGSSLLLAAAHERAERHGNPADVAAGGSAARLRRSGGLNSATAIGGSQPAGAAGGSAAGAGAGRKLPVGGGGGSLSTKAATVTEPKGWR